MTARDYPPAGVVHVLDCDEAPRERLLVISARSLRQSHDRPHRCITSAVVAANADCVIERVDYELHDYVESTIWPVDATRPLCRACRGTHAGSPFIGLATARSLLGPASS
ncbi:hypothetical protein [Actinoplanes sp. HUAS TT8]|uniref:hypothetical protein n=1 Tax=Actinoplanes sp. HUAS TT8 TaxID=3447453 RepID=UPI003F526819